MTELKNEDFEDAINEYVPAHQRSILLEALHTPNFDFNIAGLTLTGEHKINGPIVKTSIIERKGSLWQMVQDEVFDFLCTKSAKYKTERGEAGVSAKNAIGIIAASLAATYHVAFGVIAGVVTLAVMSAFKITKNAWCQLRKKTP